MTIVSATVCSSSSAFSGQLLDYIGTIKQLAGPLHKRRIFRFALALLRGAALIAISFTAGSVPALAQFSGPTPLTLFNGWTNVPFGTSIAMVEEVSGIVQFRGTIASGNSAELFVLPAALAPATDVYIPVDLCNATNGRLHIMPSGEVDIQPFDSNAQCFTSLDGVSFIQ